MAKGKIKEIVSDILTPFLAENGLELYNVEFVKESKDWFLRVYIDKAWEGEEAYIGTDDCELVSRYLSAKMDELDPIEQNYYLEVSSPGMDRALIHDRDFQKYKGRQVEISLYQNIEGRKHYDGVLVGLEDASLVITDAENKTIRLPLDAVAKTKLKVVL